jgi:hypothetical protein
MQQVSISIEPRPVFVISKVSESVDFAGLVKLVCLETSWLANTSTERRREQLKAVQAAQVEAASSTSPRHLGGHFFLPCEIFATGDNDSQTERANKQAARTPPFRLAARKDDKFRTLVGSEPPVCPNSLFTRI